MANTNLIKALVAQREGPRLDFKRDDYHWSVQGALELSKDIMAIANMLPIGSACRGYILVGVEEDPPEMTGRIVGYSPDPKLRDAEMQEKVKGYLNRQPVFTFETVTVDGNLVGVFEIAPGARPYYSVGDFQIGTRTVLRKNAAYYRTGARNEVAPPPEILAWASDELHDNLSRQLGFMVEAIEGNPFHWSKHALYCEPLSSKVDTLRKLNTSIQERSLRLSVLQQKCVVESAHEALPALQALCAVAFQLSGRRGVIWLSVTNSVKQLAGLFPFKRDLPSLDPQTIVFGEDEFSLYFCELLQHMLLFEEARNAD